MAMVDVLSHGRLEAGFVRGVPYEILPANSNPVRMNERHWEALDLIVKAWTHHDGPFSHEGRFFHHRAINIWPRPLQQPHPPIWVSTTSTAGAAAVGSRGYIQATFLTGFETTRKIFDAYRQGWRQAGRGPDVPVGRLAYAALVYVGENETRARAGAEKLLWYITANKVPQHFSNPPGYLPVAMNIRLARGAHNVVSAFGTKQGTVEGAIEAGTMFAGNPDQVFDQFKKHWDYVGGYGNLLIMGQAGFLDHDDSVHGIRMFAREVYPRLKELYPDMLATSAGGNQTGTAAAGTR
jgi:alkanesulfonate monooxygenase SsuD/methylene tetrahydromethanopterin reductase-like flavin-dependent oxidoreductase (luciferase family)